MCAGAVAINGAPCVCVCVTNERNNDGYDRKQKIIWKNPTKFNGSTQIVCWQLCIALQWCSRTAVSCVHRSSHTHAHTYTQYLIFIQLIDFWGNCEYGWIYALFHFVLARKECCQIRLSLYRSFFLWCASAILFAPPTLRLLHIFRRVHRKH